MKIVPRILAGVGVAVVAGVGGNAAAHYNFDENANVHEAQACAVELGVKNVAAAAVRETCGSFNFFADNSSVTNGTIKVTDTAAFMQRELPMAELADRQDVERRDRIATTGYGIAALLGAYVILRTKPSEKESKEFVGRNERTKLVPENA